MKYDDTEIPIKSHRSSRKSKLRSTYDDSEIPKKYKRLYDNTEFPIKSNSSRKRKLPSRFSDSVMPEKYKRLYDNINRSSIPDEVKNDVIEMVEKEKCKVGVVNDYVEKRSDEKEFNMDDLNDAIEKLGLDGGGVLKALVEQEEADISTAVAEVIRGLKEPPRVESQIALPQVPKSQILMGYVNAIYAKVNTTLDECMRLLWTKDLQAALASYVGGKLALMTISNPGTIASFINTLTTTIAPYVSAGTGILSTVALGTIIKKVFGHLATTSAKVAINSTDAISTLHERVNRMKDEEVVTALMSNTSELSNATANLFQSLKANRPTDYDALARILPEIDFNLDIEDPIKTAEMVRRIYRVRRRTQPDAATGPPAAGDSTAAAGPPAAGSGIEGDDAAGDSTAATIFKAPAAGPPAVATTTVAGTMEEGDDEESNTDATAMDTEGDDAAPTAAEKRSRFDDEGENQPTSKKTKKGAGKSKKRQTKNKKNKARKTKKNKRSSKKKVHKKK